MDIIIKKRAAGSPAARSQKIAQPSPFDKRFGAWGKVDVLHSDDNTVDIYLDSGIHLKRVPVASKEWVVSGQDAEKDYNSGERDLPPVQARVFIMMPTCTYSDCFVMPFSGFSTIDQTAPYMEDDREKIKERITPSGWHIIDDCVTGSHKAVSPDKKTSLEIDYGTEQEPKEDAPELRLSLFEEINIKHIAGDSCAIKIFDTDIVIKPGEVSFKPKETIIEVIGNAKIDVSGDATVKGDNITAEASASAKIKAPKVHITGGQLTVNGTAAPASGPFCGIPACLFTGAPHGGNMVNGT
jgi:hypothetical protein